MRGGRGGRTLDGRTLDGRTLDGRTLDGRTLYGRTLYGRTLDGRTLYGRTLYGRTLDWQPEPRQSVNPPDGGRFNCGGIVRRSGAPVAGGSKNCAGKGGLAKNSGSRGRPHVQGAARRPEIGTFTRPFEFRETRTLRPRNELRRLTPLLGAPCPATLNV